MTTSPLDEYYKECQYFIGKKTDGFAFRYPTTEFAGHFCLPDGKFGDSKETYEAFKAAFANSVLGSKATTVFTDVWKSSGVLVFGFFASILLNYGYLWVIRKTAGLIVYGAILLTFGILAISYFYTIRVRDTFDQTQEQESYNNYTYVSYTILAVIGILALTLVCFFNAVLLGIAVFKTTAQYVAENMQVFILPGVSVIICGLFYLIWVSAAIFIYSIGQPQPRAGYPFVTEIIWEENVKNILLYFVFCLLWVNSFIIGAVQFIIGASTCIWYFTSTSDSKAKGSIRTGVNWFFKYHWASIAFGSLIIATC